MPIRFAHRFVWATLFVLFAAGSALAQDASTPGVSSTPPPMPADAADFVGQWVMAADATPDAKCPISLTDQPASQDSWVVQALDACPPGYPTVSSWAVEDGGNTLILFDRDGHAALSVKQNADGLLDNQGTGQPLMFLLAPYEQGDGEQDTD